MTSGEMLGLDRAACVLSAALGIGWRGICCNTILFKYRLRLACRFGWGKAAQSVRVIRNEGIFFVQRFWRYSFQPFHH